jgi:hypothetical protein
MKAETDRKHAKQQRHGEALVYLYGKLVHIVVASQKYQNETLPSLQHTEEQRMQDMHSIEAALRSGDFAAIQNLADDFRKDEPSQNPFGREYEITVAEDEIPF